MSTEPTTENTVYLKDGQEAKLIQKLADNKYLIAPVFEYDTYEDETYTEIGEEKVVTELFTKPPEPFFDAKILAAKNRLKETERKHRLLSLENAQISAQIRTLKQTHTDFKRLIINKEHLLTANRLTVIKDYTPVDLKKIHGWDSDQFRFCINFEFSIIKNEIRTRVTRLYEGESDYGVDIDSEIGILVDKSDEEIIAIIKNKASSTELSDWNLERIADIYLDAKLLSRKKNLLQAKNEEAIEEIKKEIELKKVELSLLQGE